MPNPWVRSWPAVGTSGKEYKVSQRADGSYGCSCPAWIFSKVRPKPDCQHILHRKLRNAEIVSSGSTTKVQLSPKAKTKAFKDDTERSITFED